MVPGSDPQKIDVPNRLWRRKHVAPRPSQYGMMDRALGQTKPKLPRTSGIFYFWLTFFKKRFPLLEVLTNFGCQVGALVLPSAQARCQLIGSERKAAFHIDQGNILQDDRPVPGVKGWKLSLRHRQCNMQLVNSLDMLRLS